MAVYGGFRVLLLEFCNQLAQGLFLLRGAGITRLKGVIIAANIANTYGVGVVAGAVGSGYSANKIPSVAP